MNAIATAIVPAPAGAARSRPDGWLLAALLVAALVVLPLLALAWTAAQGSDGLWSHIAANVLPRAAWNTALLLLGVGALVVSIGTGAAWLVTAYEFPGRATMAWALLLPLAVPTYIVAYAYLDLLHPLGPVQAAVRALLGYDSPRDFRLPDIRGLAGCIVLLGFVLYPYVYMTTRAMFMTQAASLLEAARTLGAGRAALFFRVALPLARPAIAVGAALVRIRGIRKIGLFLKLLALLSSLTLLMPTARPKDPAKRRLKVKLSIYMMAAALSRYNKLGDPEMAEVISSTDAQIVITHSVGPPRVEKPAAQFDDVVGAVRAFLQQRVARAEAAGVPRSRIIIEDTFINRGNLDAPHAWLLHMNFGYPLLEPGSQFLFAGKTTPIGEHAAAHFKKRNLRVVPEPLDEHRGTGEACVYIDPDTDRAGNVCCGVLNPKRKFGVKLTFLKKHFPRVVNWQHFGPNGQYVMGIEPANCGVEGRNVDRQRGWLDVLRPGQVREYKIAIDVVEGPAEIAEFKKAVGGK